MESQRPEFECQKCGKCCICVGGAKVNSDMWLGGSLTWNEKQQLITERKNYPPIEEGCAMLYFDEAGLAHCLVAELFGGDKRDINCINYPGDKLCERELNEQFEADLAAADEFFGG